MNQIDSQDQMKKILEKNELIKQINQTDIKPIIEIENLLNIVSIIEKKKILPIYYYSKIIKINKTNNCKYCSRKSIYYDNFNYYCWEHSQKLNFL
jgi:hypothetical protein